MLPYHDIAKEIFTIPAFEIASKTIGPLSVRWYGFMYVLGYLIAFRLLKTRARIGLFKVSYRGCENLITYMIVGMLLGARFTYALVYNWDYYSVNPLHILRIWEGGLSFHGAAMGMVVAGILFSRRYKINPYTAIDTLAYCAGPGLFLGRIGNFINGELYGRQTDLPWAMIFPDDKLQVPRHPSQLYQGFTEGLLLFLLLYWAQKRMLQTKTYRNGTLAALFMMIYGVFRFLTEFAREPDAQLGFVLGPFSMGQLLCFIMIVASVFVYFHSKATEAIFVPKAQSEKDLNAET
jgi:phosphatidylglycerol:prolipoprotein diacylglycerol transferase